MRYSAIDQHSSQSSDIRNRRDPLEVIHQDRFEPKSPCVVLLDGGGPGIRRGTRLMKPRVYLWESDQVDVEEASQTLPEDIIPEQARYARNYNALKTMHQTIQANEVKPSLHPRTHHEKTNCEIQMLLLPREHDLHAHQCPGCAPALVGPKWRLPHCKTSTRLGENGFPAISWYTAADFSGYETASPQIPDSLTTAEESEDKSICGPKMRMDRETPCPGTSSPTFLFNDHQHKLLIATVEKYLSSPSRRKISSSRIGSQETRPIRRGFSIPRHEYNVLERASNDRSQEKYNFDHALQNHRDHYYLGARSFIEPSSDDPSYHSGVYSIHQPCDSINSILPQQKHSRGRRVESFPKGLEDWRNAVEGDSEQPASKHTVKIRWTSPYPRPTGQSSTIPSKTMILPQRYLSTEACSALRAPLISKPTTSSRSVLSGLVAKIWPWIQLVAGIALIAIAAYFDLNHCLVTFLVLYLAGEYSGIFNTSQKIRSASTNLQNSLIRISLPSIRFINKVRNDINNKLKIPGPSGFLYAIHAGMDGLNCSWISVTQGLGVALLRVAKLAECTRVEFQGFVEKVLTLCMVCAANTPHCESRRIASKSDIKYNSSYEQYWRSEEAGSWITDEDEIPTTLPSLPGDTSRNHKLYLNIRDGKDSFSLSSHAPASFGFSKSPGYRIRSDLLDGTVMSMEDRLVSNNIYPPARLRTDNHELCGEPITAYASMINAPALDPVLTIENQDNLLTMAQAHFPTHQSPAKSYSHSSNLIYHTGNNFDTLWMSRHPVALSTLPEHTSYYTTPTSGWHFADDFLGSTSSPPNAYCQPPASIPVSLPTAYTDNLKPLITGPMNVSPIIPYLQSAEIPRFLPIAPTPPPPVPPPKPRKRRRSSSLKEGEGGNSGGSAGQEPATKRQKKTMLFKCHICKHDIAAPRMNLTRHIKSVHADSRQRRIECEWPGCATTFQAARKDNYRAHLRKHQEKL